jgi:hypothetical protein
VNISRGVYRLAQTIKWLGRVLGVAWLIALAAFSPPAQDAIPFAVAAVLLVVITAGVAWILEGFSGE